MINTLRHNPTFIFIFAETFRTVTMNNRVLTIAGSDCSGGAGIQADLKTISALGGYAASAITAVTVQNTCGVYGIHAIPPETVRGQIEAVMTDIEPDAVKIGMTNDAETVIAIAETLRKFKPKHIVFDPVMVSTSGCRLMEEEAILAVTEQLMPISTIITPNLKEAETLLGVTIKTVDEMIEGAKELLRYGSQAVLVKGGHLSGNDMTDVMMIRGEAQPKLYTSIKIDSKNTHGTGCTLSSAIATLLSQGKSLDEAVKGAKEYVQRGIESATYINIGKGHGPLNHFFSRNLRVES